MKFGIFAFCALAGVVMIYIGINGFPDTGDVGGGIIENPTSVCPLSFLSPFIDIALFVLGQIKRLSAWSVDDPAWFNTRG